MSEHLGAALQGGLHPLAVQVGADRIGAQVAPPCAVRVHVWHLRHIGKHRVIHSQPASICTLLVSGVSLLQTLMRHQQQAAHSFVAKLLVLPKGSSA